MKPPRNAAFWVAVLLTSLLWGVEALAQTPNGRAWADRNKAAETRAAALISAMTLEEKFQQLVGAPGIVAELPDCYGARHVPGIPRLGVPTLRITNGPVGIGQNDCVPAGPNTTARDALMSPNSAKATAAPSGMAVAASFDRAIAADFGDLLGAEARALALHVVEAPGLNLARVPQAGRNFEYFGEDPFLTGTMATQEIRHIQAHGVIAMAKHYVANEQETDRMSVNEVISDRVLHELYLLPFEMAVKQGRVASMMCSYNRVNGPYACEDRHLLTEVLRNQWKFTGYVQSDFFANHSTVASMRAGLDHEMPGSANHARDFFSPDKLNAALGAHELDVADIDRALGRRYIEMFRLGIFDRPVAQTQLDVEHGGQVARRIGENAAVLLKNAGDVLPLNPQNIRSIALIGHARYAATAVSGCCGGSSDVIPHYTVTPLAGVQNSLKALRSGASASLTVVKDDNSNLDAAVAAARAADVVIAFSGTLAEEGRDLPSIRAPEGQDEMIAALAAANPRTVVVLKDNASTLTPWIDNVAAVLEAWFPGQEDGNIVARLLFGQALPSGKLPVTFPKRLEDLPVHTPRQWPGVGPDGAAAHLRPPGPVVADQAAQPPPVTTVEYAEGLEIGYRSFDARAIRPAFPFGFGLSYTTFAIGNVHVRPGTLAAGSSVEVSFTVQNTGSRRGAEVPQVYVALPDAAQEPPKRLVGFEKVWLDPGETRSIRICVDPQAANHPLGVWDFAAQAWKTLPGAYRFSVGSSSADVKPAGAIVLRGGSARGRGAGRIPVVPSTRARETGDKS